MAFCDNCHGVIVWAEVTLGTGEIRRRPFDDPPAENGPSTPFQKPPAPPAHLKRWSIQRGRATPATEEDCRLRRPLFVCHFDTCSQRRR